MTSDETPAIRESTRTMTEKRRAPRGRRPPHQSRGREGCGAPDVERTRRRIAIRRRGERLQKILSQAGVASRRKAEELIVEGRVTVNGKTITELGSKADLEHDHIKVDGTLLRAPKHTVYIALNKPKELRDHGFRSRGTRDRDAPAARRQRARVSRWGAWIITAKACCC